MKLFDPASVTMSVALGGLCICEISPRTSVGHGVGQNCDLSGPQVPAGG